MIIFRSIPFLLTSFVSFSSVSFRTYTNLEPKKKAVLGIFACFYCIKTSRKKKALPNNRMRKPFLFQSLLNEFVWVKTMWVVRKFCEQSFHPFCFNDQAICHVIYRKSPNSQEIISLSLFALKTFAVVFLLIQQNLISLYVQFYVC